jgi:hypothetical protein
VAATTARVPELAGIIRAEARRIIERFVAASPRGGWLPASPAMELLLAGAGVAVGVQRS